MARKPPKNDRPKNPKNKAVDSKDQGAVDIVAPTFGGTAPSTPINNAPGASQAVTEIVNNANQGTTANPATPTAEDEVAAAVKKLLADAGVYGDELASKYITPESFQTINAATSPEMQAYLAALNQQMQQAGQYTDLENESINNLRAGLAGYAAPEVQAFREAAQQEINRQYQTQRRDLMTQAARFGIRGPAATAQMQDLGVGKLQTQGNLERDLLVKNADEVQRRKEAFSNTIRQTEDARFGRQSQASQTYGGALSGEEAARTGREIFNANQKTNRDVTKAGLALSGAGLYAGQFGSQQAADMARQQWEDYLKQQTQIQQDNNSWMQKYYDLQAKQINKNQGQIGVF